MTIGRPLVRTRPVDWGFVGCFSRSSNFRISGYIDETYRQTVSWLTGRRVVRRLATAWLCWVQMLGSYLRAPYGSYVESYVDVSTPNMCVYLFRTYHMSFIQNKHVKHDETYIVTQRCFKTSLSNDVNIFGRLTSKLNETWETDFKHLIKSFKNHIRSWITHKHIKPHMRQLGHLVS